jgi:flavorubredoxin
MRALVVYETMFGNTKAAAERIAEGLGEGCVVDLRDVDDARPVDLSAYQLVVLGGPTHAFGPSTPASREEARNRFAAPGASHTGIAEWATSLGAGYRGKVAAFDTRTGTWGWTGSASRTLSRRLRRGGHPLLARTSFTVTSPRGPLKEGELYRARTWGSELSVLVRTAIVRAG